MTSQVLFSDNDSARLATVCKRFQRIGYGFLVVMALGDIGVAYVASTKNPIIFWPILLVTLVFLVFVFYIVFFKRIKLMKQDLAEQIKLVGQFEITSKTETDKQLLVDFNSADLGKISLNRASFDKVHIGDNLHAEFARQSKFLFALSREGEMLIER